MTPNPADRITELRRTIPAIEVDEAQARFEAGAVVLDVREPEETALGTLPNAITIPRGVLELEIGEAIPDTDTPVMVYCAAGVRSLYAVETLQSLGYTAAVSLNGGFEAWKQAGLPWQPSQDSPEYSDRYSRHLRIPEIAVEGQRKLLQARVLVIGAGGLGSPAALYLAAAGVGTIGIVDDDVVDLSNLQRQILHRTQDIGTPKVRSARRTLEALNPDVVVETHQQRLTAQNATALFGDYDVVVDGSDSFETRYVVNDACMQVGLPQVHGSVFRFDGQVTTFDPRREESPCYRCLFPSPPPVDLAPNCAVAGVLGVLPGVVGTLQATEAIKLVLGLGDPLIGRLLLYDARSTSFRTVKVRRNPTCSAHHA